MNFCRFCEHFIDSGDKYTPGWCSAQSRRVLNYHNSKDCGDYLPAVVDKYCDLELEGYVTSPAGHRYSVVGCKAILHLIRNFEFCGKSYYLKRIRHVPGKGGKNGE